MPALPLARPSWSPVARQLLGQAASEPLPTTTIVAIVFAAIVPVLLIAAVVIYFLGFYGRPGYVCCIPYRKSEPKPDGQRPSPYALEGKMKESGIPLQHVESQSTLSTRDSSPNRTYGAELERPAEVRTFV